MKIALDFDGTVVTHEYPKVGKDIGAVPVLKRLCADGVKLILWTMRSGELLEDAKEWFKKNDIPLYAIGTDPGQWRWTKSTKVNADLYLDDKALGAPVKMDPELSGRSFIDWARVEDYFYGGGESKD